MRKIFNKIEDDDLPFDADGNAKLQNKIKNLKILPKRGNLTSSYEQKINGRWFTLNEKSNEYLKNAFNF